MHGWATYNQQDSLEAILSESRNLVKLKQWRSAINVLRNGEIYCDSQNQNSCRAIIYFNLGYVFRQFANSDHKPQSKKEKLDTAELYYRKIIRLYTNNTQALNNLALLNEEMGKTEQAIEIYQDLVDLNANPLNYLLKIGDLQLSSGDTLAALRTFDQAAEKYPFTNVPRQRQLSIYTNLVDVNPQKLLDFSLKMKNKNFPALAKSGLETIINSTCGKDLYEKGLIHWANLLANENWVFKDNLNYISDTETCKHQANLELHEMMKSPLDSLGNIIQLVWWGENEGVDDRYSEQEIKRPTVAVEIFIGIADKLVSEGSIYKAIQIYEGALEMLLNLYDQNYDYLMSEAAGVFTKLAQKLAMLYINQPEYDPRGKKFDNLIRELFEGKGKAYSQRDKMAIWQYHTTLGIILSEKEIWGPGWKVRSAIFQLKGALKYQPEGVEQPFLHELLAKAYLADGSKRNAIERYILAIRSYLNSDNLSRADTVLEIMQNLQDLISQEIGLEEKIIRSRFGIGLLTSEHFNRTDSTYYGNSSNYDWLRDNNFSDRFAQIQRFKAFSDLARKAMDLNQQNEAQLLSAKALFSLSKIESINSVEDYIRIQFIESKVTDKINISSTQPLLEVSPAGKTTSNVAIWSLKLPSSNQLVTVKMDRNVLVAGEIIQYSYDKYDLNSYLPRMKLDSDKLIIYQENLDIEKMERFKEELIQQKIILKAEIRN